MLYCGNANAHAALLASVFRRERPESSCEAKNRRHRYGVTKSRHSQRPSNYNLGWSETLRVDRIRDRRKSLRPGLGSSPLRDEVRGRTIYDVRSARRRSLQTIESRTTSPNSSPSMPPGTIGHESRLSPDDDNESEWEKEYRLWLRSFEASGPPCLAERRCSVQDTISEEEMEMFIKFINFAD